MAVNTIGQILNNTGNIYASPSYQNRNVQSKDTSSPLGGNKVMPQSVSNGEGPLVSRYTYAVGSDGKRYVLQLRMDIASSSVNFIA